jgi:hypothetical protein
LNAELDEHLEDERADGSANRRNGHSRKSVLTGTSKMTLSIPRDREGSFDPKLIVKLRRTVTLGARTPKCLIQFLFRNSERSRYSPSEILQGAIKIRNEVNRLNLIGVESLFGAISQALAFTAAEHQCPRPSI